jgi:hypothetical protein
MAYKVVRTGTSWEVTGENSNIIWYAPEYEGGIKGMRVAGSKDGYGQAEHRWEIVSADPKWPQWPQAS